MSLARDRCGGGRRIARGILGGCPDDAALARVEGDDAGLGAADVRDHPAALDERRAGGAEEALRHVELLRGLVRPQHVAAFDGGGTQLALCAERIDDPVGNNGHGARSLVEAEIVAVRRRRAALPLGRPARRIDRLDDLAIPDPMEKDDVVADDHRAAQSLPDLLPPDDRRAAGGKAVTMAAPR